MAHHILNYRLGLFTFVSMLIFIWACDRKSSQISAHEDAMDDQILVNESVNSEDFFIIKSTGDTIPKNIPIKLQGQPLPKKVVKERKSVPILPKKDLRSVFETSKSSSPKVHQLTGIEKIVPGVDSTFLVDTLLFKKETKLIKHPQPVQALPPRIRDNAKVDIQVLQPVQGMNSFRVEALLEDRWGNVWMGTSQGLSVYNGNQFIHYTSEEGLSSNMIFALLEDQEGNIWIGTDNGLNRFDGQRFTPYTYRAGDTTSIAANWVRSIIQANDKQFFLGTHGNGLSQMDPYRETFSNPLSLLDANKEIGVINSLQDLEKFDKKIYLEDGL